MLIPYHWLTPILDIAIHQTRDISSQKVLEVLDKQFVAFLQHIPETLYFAALIAIITSLTTLAGIFFTNKANNERFLLQFDLERKEKNRDLTRDKLEELYILVERWSDCISRIYLSHAQVMNGDVDYKTLLESEKNRGENNELDFARIKMLIALYFPLLYKEYEKLLQTRSKANKIMLSFQEQCVHGNQDGSQVIESFLDSWSDFDKESEKILETIAKQSI